MLDFESMAKISELSLFFPTYNEEGNIEKVVKAARKVLKVVAKDWEIIIVNDGSIDGTLKKAESLSKKDKNIKAVSHKVNRGYGGALKTGFKSAKYRWVAFTDSDGQFDFSEIAKFIEMQKEKNADLVLGYRLNRADSFMRKVYTWGWSVVLPRLLFGLNVRDYSCGFKMIRKKVFNTVSPLKGEEKVTQIEMLVKAKRAGFKIAQVGVHHYPRSSGKQTGANIKVVVRSVISLLRLWVQLR